jgi:preprotein translocase subunit SecY
MNTLNKIWQYKDLRTKILVTAALLALTRVLAHIPLPGVNLDQLQSFFQNNQIFGLLDMFSGGTMSQFSIVLMGVGPYITSSIIFQLLAMVIPKFEEMQKESEAGRQKINQYIRLATVPLAIIQAYSMLTLLKSQGIIPGWTIFDLSLMLISAAAGTILLMWIGELISEKGIGNGVSLIITLGILSGFPKQIRNTWAIVSITEAQRNIRVSYARRLSGSRTLGSIDTYLPVRVNTAGVIPIIFAMSVMIVPGVVGKYLEQARAEWIQNGAKFVVNLFQNNLFYGIFYFVLVFAFTYFYTSVVFKPDQIAENLQKRSGYIPGIRPGTETKQYLAKIIGRVTFLGGLFLGFVAVLPFIVQAATGITTLVLGGTGILILVSVVIETMRQIDSQVVMHTYDNF